MIWGSGALGAESVGMLPLIDGEGVRLASGVLAVGD
jgi:hypothetical protein